MVGGLAPDRTRPQSPGVRLRASASARERSSSYRRPGPRLPRRQDVVALRSSDHARCRGAIPMADTCPGLQIRDPWASMKTSSPNDRRSRSGNILLLCAFRFDVTTGPRGQSRTDPRRRAERASSAGPRDALLAEVVPELTEPHSLAEILEPGAASSGVTATAPFAPRATTIALSSGT